MPISSTRLARRRAAASLAVAGALVLAATGVAAAQEQPPGGSAPPAAQAPANPAGPGGKKAAPPRKGRAKINRRDTRVTFDHTEYRHRGAAYELARTYADQAIATAPNCAAYAGIARTTDFLSRNGVRRPSVATPILIALSPIYKFANWLVGHFFTTPCDLAKQFTSTAAAITAVAYWEGEVYHRVIMHKDERWGRVDLCRFAAYTYFRSGGRWYTTQTMNAHLPARGSWSDCRP